jgi:hypothetical protein
MLPKRAAQKPSLRDSAEKADGITWQPIEPGFGGRMMDVRIERSASQTLMSGRRIILIYNLRDACVGEFHAAGFTGPNQRNLDAPLFA